MSNRCLFSSTLQDEAVSKSQATDSFLKFRYVTWKLIKGSVQHIPHFSCSYRKQGETNVGCSHRNAVVCGAVVSFQAVYRLFKKHYSKRHHVATDAPAVSLCFCVTHR